jgi:hypothetical protein
MVSAMLGPDDDPSEWVPCDWPCPDCGAPTLTAPWWDDAPENGGEVIGDLRQCTVCDWFERF